MTVKQKLVTGNVLRMKKLKLSDQGEYSCVGEKYGNTFNVTSKLLVGGKTWQPVNAGGNYLGTVCYKDLSYGVALNLHL